VPFSATTTGFDDQAQRLRRLTDGLDHLDPLLTQLADDLAQLWQDNIDAGPNERWEAGPSYRAQSLGGVTLVDSGQMKASILGRQTGPAEITVGSDLTVAGGWNLLAIHEFGANVRATSAAWLTFRYPLGSGQSSNRSATDSGWAKKKEVRIPRRPTAPFDWDRSELTPEADTFVCSRINDYLAEAMQ
jgi:phage gpG-like protein